MQVEEHMKSCDACQRHKITGKKHYSQMPMVSLLRDKDHSEKVFVDCARPSMVCIKSDITQELKDTHPQNCGCSRKLA